MTLPYRDECDCPCHSTNMLHFMECCIERPKKPNNETFKLANQMMAVALEIAKHSGDGALHIFIEDGNCEIESLQFCLEQPNILTHERLFVEGLIANMCEQAIFGAWALAQTID